MDEKENEEEWSKFGKIDIASFECGEKENEKELSKFGRREVD